MDKKGKMITFFTIILLILILGGIHLYLGSPNSFGELKCNYKDIRAEDSFQYYQWIAGECKSFDRLDEDFGVI